MDAPSLPLVSLIITTKNRSGLVGAAIESALAVHGDGFSTEVIVVDDASTDDTPAVLERYPVQVVRTTGLGIAGARNTGLDAATGDFIAILDDDDVWLPDAVRAQMETFDSHPEYASVHGQAQRTDANLVPYAEPFPGGPASSGWIFEDLLAYCPQIGTVVTRTAAVREAGGFDVSLSAVDEWDMMLSVSSKHQVGRIAVPVMLFRQRGTPEDLLMRKRFPYVGIVFKRQVAGLPIRQRLRLQPVMWQHRGWCASFYLNAMQQHQAAGDKAGARRSLRYAFQVSPPHTAVELFRRWRHPHKVEPAAA
jgi:glycosyltransferase involved in cell wall biosynthesis